MKVYIVDDDPISCHLIEFVLQASGVPEEGITTFLAAEQASQLLMEMEPADFPKLLFLDLNMPHMNGWQFLDALAPFGKQLKGKCRIYILTSSIDEADRVRSKEYELVSGLLHKPVSFEDMEVVLAEIKSPS